MSRQRTGANGPRVEVFVNGEQKAFDRVIEATPPHATAAYLDLTLDERDLYARAVNTMQPCRLAWTPSRTR